MFDFNKVEAPHKLNRDYILSKVTDAMVFGYYFGKFDLKNVYPSKFRKDKNPSTGFYISSAGKIIYNDFTNGDKLDCFAFVQRLYNCSFKDSVNRIASDFGLLSGKQATPMAAEVLRNLANFDREHKKDTRIHFHTEKWDSTNLAFWKDYHITKDELKAEGIYSIKKLYINDTYIPNPNNYPRFALTIPHKGELLTKVYSPGGGDRLKWVSNIPLDLPFGVHNLKKDASFGVVAKAAKDMIILKKFLPAVIASQNETRRAMSSHTIKKLKFLFPTNYTAWDNDETGLEGMEDMKQDGFIPLHVPVTYLEHGIKDFSDMAKAYGLDFVEALLKDYKLI